MAEKFENNIMLYANYGFLKSWMTRVQNASNKLSDVFYIHSTKVQDIALPFDVQIGFKNKKKDNFYTVVFEIYGLKILVSIYDTSYVVVKKEFPNMESAIEWLEYINMEG